MTRFGFVRAALSREPSFGFGLTVTIATMGVATMLRWLLGNAAQGVPFVTYYPAIMVCAMLAGWRYGLACTLISAVFANFLFLAPQYRPSTDLRSVIVMTLFVLSCATIIAITESLRRTYLEAQAARERGDLLNDELRHRVRNIFAVVQAIADQTGRNSPDDFQAQFSGRLNALANAQDLLARNAMASCDLEEIVSRACAPFRANGNFVIAGCGCAVPTESCVPLTLALHELGTNATKHGALSVPEGRVHIDWGVQDTDVRIEWRERGGPSVKPPARKGFGTRLLRSQRGLAGVDLAFDPAGVRCLLTVAGAEVTA